MGATNREAKQTKHCYEQLPLTIQRKQVLYIRNMYNFLTFNHKFAQNQNVRETSKYHSRTLRACHKNSCPASEEALGEAVILSFILCH